MRLPQLEICKLPETPPLLDPKLQKAEEQVELGQTLKPGKGVCGGGGGVGGALDGVGYLTTPRRPQGSPGVGRDQGARGGLRAPQPKVCPPSLPQSSGWGVLGMACSGQAGCGPQAAAPA